MINELESRCDDGKGSWRRKGVSKVNRELVDVIDTHKFETSDDFQVLLPNDIPDRFTNKMLIEDFGINRKQAGMLTNF